MNKKSLVLLIFGIFIIIFIVPQIIHFLVYTPSPFGFIKPGEESQWIGFFGSIIGGLLTLAGVWWTIMDQDKKRKEDLTVQYKPIIIFKRSCKPELYAENIIHYKNSKNIILDFNIYIFNLGRGECYDYNISIKQISIDESEPLLKLSLQSSCNNKGDDDKSVLVNEGYLEYNAKFSASNFDINNDKIVPIYLKIKCQYHDVFNLKKYESSALIKLNSNGNYGYEYKMKIEEISDLKIKSI